METIDDRDIDGFIRHVWSQTGLVWVLEKMGSEEVDSFCHQKLTCVILCVEMVTQIMRNFHEELKGEQSI